VGGSKALRRLIRNIIDFPERVRRRLAIGVKQRQEIIQFLSNQGSKTEHSVRLLQELTDNQQNIVDSLKELPDNQQNIVRVLKELTENQKNVIGLLQDVIKNQQNSIGLLREDLRTVAWDQKNGTIQLLQEVAVKASDHTQILTDIRFEVERHERQRKQQEEEERSRSVLLNHPHSVNVFPEQRQLADVADGKIAIFGLQKAGNSWVHALLAEIFDMPYYFNLQESDRRDTRGVVNTHEPFSDQVSARHDLVHGVCLMRDLRDIVVSYFHYMQTESYQRDVPVARYGDIDTFYYDWFLTRLVPAHRFHTYWEEYASRGVPVLRYERLVQDTRGELIRLFERWGEPYDEARLDAAIQRNSLSNLKTEGKLLGDLKIESSHFRSGQVGSYKDELPAHIIADINRRFSEVLTRWGYGVE
jgi:hypothetical protein